MGPSRHLLLCHPPEITLTCDEKARRNLGLLDFGIMNIVQRSKPIKTIHFERIYYQHDKDWHYRSEERRWVALNEKNLWRKAEIVKGKVAISQLHVR